jgi:hypothetical protein
LFVCTARVVAERMRDSGARQAMMNVALAYRQLAKHAALREEAEQQRRNKRSGGLEVTTGQRFSLRPQMPSSLSGARRTPLKPAAGPPRSGRHPQRPLNDAVAVA